jgi:hypothetical protein
MVSCGTELWTIMSKMFRVSPAMSARARQIPRPTPMTRWVNTARSRKSGAQENLARATQSALIAEWLLPNDFKPEVGHRFTLRSQPPPGWNGSVNCEVTIVGAD